ncbi:hypothetical protein [Pedobacter immunditicola]|uniref:hypothetical protein n=1 Tax=Pedobacter immunditicola TaxID=3133440 RepID=UPI0030A148F8
MTDPTLQIQTETITKKQQFEEQLQILDAKYVRYFSERINEFTGETDNIYNYYRYFTPADGSVQLYLKDGLPLEIGKDCRLAFATIFNN